jgi:single-strand selective monofunctional uracil DNA glycosylase
MEISAKIIAAARALSRDVAAMRFGRPVTHVYNPLQYAFLPYEMYINRYGNTSKRAIFVGMNPGPFGMAQTGIPFGEVTMVKTWLKISAPVGEPAFPHPRRPVLGFACTRSEISGLRLWQAVSRHFKNPERFFAEFFVANYCPLAFLEESGRNRTPDRLPEGEREPLFAACDRHLRSISEAFSAEWVIGIGNFAGIRAKTALSGTGIRTGHVLHPSPASPKANRGWEAEAMADLVRLGICRSRD